MKLTAIRIILVLLSYVLAYVFAWHFGSVYFNIFPELQGDGFIPDDAASWLIGAPIALVFFISFSITALDGKNKYWWIGISLLPAILFEVVIDPLHIYIPIILALIAWGLGTMAHKTLQKLAPSFMSKIS